MTATATGQPRLLSAAYAATTAGMFALCAFVAFEATAVTTVMPTVAAELHLQAVQQVDIPIMAAYLMLVAVIFTVVNFIVDMLYVAVDPRIRIRGAQA